MTGFFWLHGESDASNPIATTQYLPNLISFINHYRASINTIVPFYIGMVMDDPKWGDNRHMMRYAQILAATPYSSLPSVYTLETSHYSRHWFFFGGHYDTKGIIDFGNALADFVENKKPW